MPFFRRRVRDALGESVADLEQAVGRPAIVREAEVWSEKEIAEVEAVRDQLNLYVSQRNRSLRADLLASGERASVAAVRAGLKRRDGESDEDYEARVLAIATEHGTGPTPEPSGRSWDKLRAEEERLARKGVVFDEKNDAEMDRALAEANARDAKEAEDDLPQG